MAVTVFIAACGDSDNRGDNPSSYFSYNPDYVAEGVELTACDKWFQIPKGFTIASDTILGLLQSALDTTQERVFDVEMTHCFLDTMTQSGLLITRIKDLTLNGDTAGFFSSYRQVLQTLYGQSGFIEGGEMIGDSIFVMHFSVSDGVIARIQAVCLSPQSDAVELNYFLPDSLYQSRLPAIKSSISSIKIMPR